MIELYSTTNWYIVNYQNTEYTVIENIEYNLPETWYEVVLPNGEDISQQVCDNVLELFHESQEQAK